jgi:predicted site-specific integrase-resolvase
LDIDSDEELDNKKKRIAYVRVSTHGQRDDLKRQIKYMKEYYPNHIIVEDIGSGINFNRKGLRKIIKWAIEGKVKEVVVAYKDRLTRFGFDLIEDLIREYSEGRVKIINKEEEVELELELAKDVLQIMNVFTAKMNGLRKYKI